MSAEKITECCANCFFARPTIIAEKFTLMECRFRAPTLPRDTVSNQWPMTSLEKWCGDYRFDSQCTNGIGIPKKESADWTKEELSSKFTVT